MCNGLAAFPWRFFFKFSGLPTKKKFPYFLTLQHVDEFSSCQAKLARDKVATCATVFRFINIGPVLLLSWCCGNYYSSHNVPYTRIVGKKMRVIIKRTQVCRVAVRFAIVAMKMAHLR